jgi:hypothetical protein
MPYRGIWTLQCKRCNQNFVIDVKPGEEILDFAKTYPCPQCKQAPNENPADGPLTRFHEIVEFHAKQS